MVRRIRSRIGSAHVIAFIALMLALTGTSIALPGNNSVDSADIKKNAVTSSDIRNKTIVSADVAKNTLNGNQINEGKLAQVPSAARAGTTANVLFAVVSNPTGANNATLVRSSQPAPTVTETTGVVVGFGRDVSSCAFTATRGGTAQTVEPAGFAEVSGAANNPNGVDVRTRMTNGNIEDGNFHLVVVCP